MKPIWPFLLLLLLSQPIFAQQKLSLHPSMMINESPVGNPINLIDEQTEAADPLSGNGGQPLNDWFAGWNSSLYPIFAYLDFGQEIELQHLFLYDLNGMADFRVWYGSPGNWSLLLSDPLNNYQLWNAHNINVSTRYLRFSMSNPNAHVGELVLYGSEQPILPQGGSCQDYPVPFPEPDPGLSAKATQSMYEVGDTAQFQIQSNQSGTIAFRLAPDRFAPAFMEGTINYQSGNPTALSYIPEAPGFLLLELSQNGQEYLAGAGVAACDIEPVTEKPSDFDTFWETQKVALQVVPINTQLTYRSDKSSPQQNTYKILLNNIDGKKVHGWVSIPNCEGPFPAILHLPPFGKQKIGPATDMAQEGAITVAISVHDYDVEQTVPDAIAYKPQDSFQDRETNYFKWSILGCIRAIDFIYSLEEFNGEDLAVTGVSQGGGLSIITAGLDQRVKYLAQGLAAFGQHQGYAEDRASGFPYWLKVGEDMGLDDEQILEETAYYDAVLFAEYFEGPSFNAVGYNDPVCPPATVFAAYNQLSGEKSMLHGVDTEHNNHPDFWEMRKDFWKNHLPLRPYPDCEVITAESQSVERREGKETIKVFPNPVTTQLSIQSEKSSQKIVEAYRLDGQLHYQEQMNGTLKKITTNEWPTGIYVLKIQTEKQIEVRKIIVKR
ncbi:MAG: acetylxylan esterase [Saprospiraceae bacterium]|nr:acetylxylan esterase [Saprospiraceae bacterium]